MVRRGNHEWSTKHCDEHVPGRQRHDAGGARRSGRRRTRRVGERLRAGAIATLTVVFGVIHRFRNPGSSTGDDTICWQRSAFAVGIVRCPRSSVPVAGDRIRFADDAAGNAAMVPCHIGTTASGPALQGELGARFGADPASAGAEQSVATAVAGRKSPTTRRSGRVVELCAGSADGTATAARGVPKRVSHGSSKGPFGIE